MKRHHVLAMGVLFGVLFLLFRKLILHGEYISYGDSPYFWSGSSFSGFSTWNDSYLGMSWSNRMFGTTILIAISNIISQLVGNPIASKIMYFAPIVLATFVIYWCSFKISKDAVISTFLALLLLLNNFTIEQYILWSGHYFWNVLGLSILLYGVIREFETSSKFRVNPLFLIGSLFVIHPFMFVLYVIVFILFGVFKLSYSYSRAGLLRFLITLLLIAGTQLYWIFPFVIANKYETVNSLYNGNRDAVYEGYKGIATYSNILNLKQYPGFVGGSNQDIVHNNFQLFFNYLTLGYLLILIFNSSKKRTNLFLLLCFLIFFNLSLGPNSIVTGSVWKWLMENVSLFGFFRSFTRFSQISFLIILYLFSINLPRNKHLINACLILCLVLVNINLFGGDIMGMIGSFNLPNEYIDLKRYLNTDKSTSVVYSLPNTPYEVNTWNQNQDSADFNQITYFKNLYLSKPVTNNSYSSNLQTRNEQFSRLFQFYNLTDYSKVTSADIGSINAKYVLVQKDLVSSGVNRTNVDVKEILNLIRTHLKLEQMLDNEYFALFVNKNYTPVISGKNTRFKKINNTHYVVEVRSFKNTDIKFLRNENRGWELFPKKINEVNLSNCDLIQGGQGNYSGECVSNSNGLKFSDISLIKGNRLPRGNQSAYFGNIWNLNSLDITKEFDNEYYKTNSDGSIDAYFDLYYTPQSYFLTGLIFTIISDIVIISISIASFLGIRSEKNTKHIPG